MPLVIPNSFAYHVLEFSQDSVSDPYTVTMASAWDSLTDTLEDVATEVRDLWDTHILPLQDEDITFLGVATVGRTSGGVLNQVEVLSGEPGGGTNPGIMPPNVSLLVKKRSVLAGRQHRGRFYVPGILSEGDVADNGVIAPASLTTFQTAFTAFLTAFNASLLTADMVILHNDTPVPVPVPTPVTSLVVDGTIATQRRRLR